MGLIQEWQADHDRHRSWLEMSNDAHGSVFSQRARGSTAHGPWQLATADARRLHAVSVRNCCYARGPRYICGMRFSQPAGDGFIRDTCRSRSESCCIRSSAWTHCFSLLFLLLTSCSCFTREPTRKNTVILAVLVLGNRFSFLL